MGCRSIGRSTVFGTVGCRFESCHPSHHPLTICFYEDLHGEWRCFLSCAAKAVSSETRLIATRAGSIALPSRAVSHFEATGPVHQSNPSLRRPHKTFHNRWAALEGSLEDTSHSARLGRLQGQGRMIGAHTKPRAAINAAGHPIQGFVNSRPGSGANGVAALLTPRC